MFTEHFATREEQRERKPEEGRESLGQTRQCGAGTVAGTGRVAEVQEPAGHPRAAFPVMA